MDKLTEAMNAVDSYHSSLSEVTNYIRDIENTFREKKITYPFTVEVKMCVALEWNFESFEKEPSSKGKYKKPTKNWRLWLIDHNTETKTACIQLSVDDRNHYGISCKMIDKFLDAFTEFIKNKEKEFKEKTGQ